MLMNSLELTTLFKSSGTPCFVFINKLQDIVVMANKITRLA
jgi:hypothetical protein